MKKYKKITKDVEACQFTGTTESFKEIRNWLGDKFHYDYQTPPTVFYDEIGIEKGLWLVKKSDGDVVVMRDDQFKDAYCE
jgi:hypothetical protein